MGIGNKIVDTAGDVAKTAISGRPEEQKQDFDVEKASSKFSMSKWMVWILLWVVLGLGVYFILKGQFKELRNYIRFIEAYSGAFITLIILIGVGRAFKHSRWAKEK